MARQVHLAPAKPAGPGHNLRAGLSKLESEAMKQQRKAQKTWAALTLAHVRHQSDWAEILRAIVASGVPAEDLRSRFGIPPSTFSRWWTGASEPARMLRTLLEREIAEVAEKIAKSKA